jgi:hypothetical protein
MNIFQRQVDCVRRWLGVSGGFDNLHRFMAHDVNLDFRLVHVRLGLLHVHSRLFMMGWLRLHQLLLVGTDAELRSDRVGARRGRRCIRR